MSKPLVATVLVLLPSISLAEAQKIPLPARSNAVSTTHESATVRPTTALMLRSAQQIREHRTVTARVRQQIRMFGQNLAGSGTYEHANVGADYLFRMQLQIAVNDQAATLMQVCDGHFLWTSRSYPGDATTVQRVDLNQVRRYLDSGERSERQAASAVRSASMPSLMSRGGLPQLLEMLAQHYEFSEPVTTMFHQAPVWTISGTISEEARRKFVGEREALPAQIPVAVVVALGKDDLFPFRIEFRNEPSRNGSEPKSIVEEVIVNANDHPMLVTEFFEVQYDAYIAPQKFEYRPVDAEVRDVTQAFVLGL